MIYKEEYRDLFSVPEEYYLAHCISADFGMGAGIVIEFNKRFDMKNRLKTKYPNFLSLYDYQVGFCNKKAVCIKEDRVMNLITKRNYWQKPTYESLKHALLSMKDICISKKINKIAMPTIGCGIDKLEWKYVSEIIKSVFEDTNIEILVCKIK